MTLGFVVVAPTVRTTVRFQLLKMTQPIMLHIVYIPGTAHIICTFIEL